MRRSAAGTLHKLSLTAPQPSIHSCCHRGPGAAVSLFYSRDTTDGSTVKAEESSRRAPTPITAPAAVLREVSLWDGGS